MYESPPVEDVRLLLRALHTYLPYSLPLYRRLQFALNNPNPPFAQIFDSLYTTSGATSSTDRWLSLASRHERAPEQVPWLCAGIDLSATGETQVWAFANWEVPEIDAEHASARDIETRERLVQSLFETIYDRDVTHMSEIPPETWLKNQKLQRGKAAYSRSRLLLGALHSNIRTLIPQEAMWRLDDGPIKYLFTPDSYVKYLFKPETNGLTTNGSVDSESHVQLPQNYKFGPLRREHLLLVLERTKVPRTVKTMSSLFSVGVFYSNQPTPIGWGFLGKDASLTSLHTEPEHRGKGLAALISKELFAHQDECFRTPGEERELEVEWAHADVDEGNVASRRVMEKMGGKQHWGVAWIEVELETLVGKDGMWRSLGK